MSRIAVDSNWNWIAMPKNIEKNTMFPAVKFARHEHA
jgi:hypothetical protein